MSFGAALLRKNWSKDIRTQPLRAVMFFIYPTSSSLRSMTFTIVDSISRPRSGSFIFDPLAPFGPSTASQNFYEGSQFKPLRLGGHPWVRAYVRGTPENQTAPRLSFLTQYTYMYGTDSFASDDSGATPVTEVPPKSISLDGEREYSHDSDSDESDEGLVTPREGTMRPNTPSDSSPLPSPAAITSPSTIYHNQASDANHPAPLSEAKSKGVISSPNAAGLMESSRPLRLHLAVNQTLNTPLQPPFKVEVRSGLTTICKALSQPSSPAPHLERPSPSPRSNSVGARSSTEATSSAVPRKNRRYTSSGDLPEIELNVSTIGGLFSNPLTFEEGVFGYPESSSPRRGELKKPYVPPDWRRPAR